MKMVYLVNSYDKWCPENNNGDYIVEAWSTKEQALEACRRLEKENSLWGYSVLEYGLDVTKTEYLETVYGKD